MPFDPKKLEEARKKVASKSPDQSQNGSLLSAAKEQGMSMLSALPDPYKLTKTATKPLGEAIFAQGHPIAGKLVENAPEIAGSLLMPPAGAAAEVAMAPTISEGKAAMGAAETAAGVEVLPFMAKDLPRNLNQAIDFSQSMDYIAKQTPEDIAKVMEPEGINNLRKVIEYTLNNFKEKLPGANEQAISRAKDVLTKAVDMAEPSLAGPRAALKNAYTRSEILSSIPKAIGLGSKVAKSSIIKGL